MIPKDRRLYIKDLAEKYINKSLDEIASENKIFVIKTDLNNFYDNKNYSGIITKFDDGKKPYEYAIFINSEDLLVRQKFTFAHELGHFFLHKENLDKGLIKDELESNYLYRSEDYCNLPENSKKMEYEANEFAGNLLMPKNKFLELINKFPIRDVANIFGVSEKAVSVRFYNLTERYE